MTAAVDEKLAPYKFHGVNLRLKSGEAIGDCPFCDKENHFFVSPKTGQYQCKVGCCDEATGNVYSFLAKIHADALKKTKKSDYERLSSLRDGMPWQIFRDSQFAWSKDQNRWLLPINNTKGALANLCVYAPPKIAALMGTAGCAQHLFLGDKISPTGPIYLCEGQWDAMALRWLLEKNNLDPSLWSVLGCPGSNSFKKEWVELLKNRDVFMFFDKDTAGSTGMDRIVDLVGNKAKLHRIQWPSDLPEGYDVRDFVSHKADKPKAAWQSLQSLFPKEAASAGGKARPKLIRAKFEQVVKDFKKAIHIDKAWIDALAISCAVAVSGKLKNDPLWMFLVGPPGSGKTLLVESFLNHKSGTVYMSKITRQALVSGFRGEEDYSILPTLNGKCFIVKDFTAVLAMPLQAQIEIFGILRDVYDGHCTVPFGNMEPKVFNDLYFSNISSVTDVIRKVNLADLGERFLKLELLDEEHDPKVHIRAALSSVENDIGKKAAQEEFLRDSVAAFMERPFDERKLPKIPAWLTERLVNLAQLGANLRAVVAKGGGGDLSYRPRAEVGTRLAKCLGKLARCLCWVFDKKKIDEEVYRLVSKVACDTVLGWDLEIIHALYGYGRAGMTLPEIGVKMQLSHTGIDRRLENLQHLNIVYKTPEIRRDGRGRRYNIWHLADHIREMWRESSLEYAPPPVVKFKPRNGYTPKRPSKPTKAKTKFPPKRKVKRAG